MLNGLHSAQQFSAGFIKFFFDQVPEGKNIKIELTWDNGSYLDAHFIKPGGQIDYPFTDSVYWNNLSPDWGKPGVVIDNPVLNKDARGGADSPETITLIKPYETGDYIFKVHKYNDDWWDPGPYTKATVKIYIGDELKETYSRSLFEYEAWTVAKISMPDGIVKYDGSINEDLTWFWWL